MSTVYYQLSVGNFTQDWSNAGLLTTANDWSGVPSIMGYRGDDLTTATGTDPQSLTANDLLRVQNVMVNQTTPNTNTGGGLAEFALTDPVVAMQGSGTADAPYLVIHLDATGRENIVVAYNVRDIDGSADNAIQQVALQYRTSDTGTWINVPAGYVADATTAGTATQVTAVNATLPSGANNAATLQVRIITTNAIGNDEWVGIDDIVVSSVASGAPPAAPVLSITDVTQNEGNAGTTSYTFTVSLTAPAPVGGVTFDIATADNGATAGVDYVANTLTGQTIAAGASSYTFTVVVNGDTVVEPNENFFVNITNVVGATVGDAQGLGTITNDDQPPGVLSVGDVTVTEGDTGTTNGVFTVTRTGGAGGAVSASYTITLPGGAGGADGTDVSATLSGTVSFADGDSASKTIAFTVNGDRTVETNETFTLALSGEQGGATIGTATGTATITNDDVAGTVSIADVTISEGTGGTTNAVVTLTRTGGSGDFTVDYATQDGTALAGSDYTATSGTATFTGGSNTATVTIPISPDGVFEGDEAFRLNLSNPTSGATVTGPTFASVTIIDDDSGAAAGSVSIGDAQIVEGNAGTSNLVFTLTRTGGTGAFTVDYATADGGENVTHASATAGSDYAALNGTIVFATGETTKTVTIAINGDVTPELAEDFRVLLTNATAGATITDGTAVGTITNDDTPPSRVTLLSEDFSTFTAAGFAPTPTAGQLDSDIWRVVGQSDAPTNPAYGFTGASGTDFGRGIVPANPTTAGVYAATGNSALILQPTGAEFDVNGFVEARIQNTTGTMATAFDVAFDWTFRNNEARSANLELSYSTDGTTFIAVPAANFSTPAALDALGFVRQPESVSITGLTVADQGYVYLRWAQTSSAGGGSRDEIGIDNVVVVANGGTPAPLVAVSDVSVNEDTGLMTFTVTRTNAVAGAFTLNYATADGTAVAGTDYNATSGTLSFAENQVSATVNVAITPDAIPEFNDTLLLNLSNATGATITDAQAVGTIVNDDGAPISISIGDVSIVEGQSGTSIATFTVTRSGGTGAFDVNYATANGTATAGSDYVAATGTLNFAAGVNTQTISVTINGDLQSEATESFTVNLSGSTNNALFADASATGTIVNDDATLIHDIQGTSYYSPFVAGQGITAFNVATTVTVTVSAIVTALDGDGARQGFYLTEETADWDGDNRTSEGIFVMTRNDASVGTLLATAIPGLAVGDRVTVTAQVMEYQGFATTMPVTTLVNPVVTITGNAQPLPVLVLDASHPIPNAIFTSVTPNYTDSVDDIGDSFDATNYALSFYETVEGMLVTVPDMVAADGVALTSGGQPYFKAYSTVHANPEQINARGGYTIAGDPANAPPDTANPNDGTPTDGRRANDGDINPDILEIDFTDFAVDAPAGLAQTVSVGDRFGDITGIINFDFTEAKLFVTSYNPASFVNTQPTQDVTTLGADTRALTVATFNVENLDPGDVTPAQTAAQQGKFFDLARAIVNNLNSPDILSIEEIQDNNGATNDGTTDASTTWSMLVSALNIVSGKTYQWVDQAPVNGAEGGEPGGNIRVGFLYNTDRVQLGDLAANATLEERRAFTDRVGDGVRDAGDRILYSDDMIAGEINAADWTTTRKSLLGQFTFNGNAVFVMANHLPSKGGSGELWQFNQSLESGAPANADWAQRTAIGLDLYTMMSTIQTGSPAAGIVAGGDFNDFYFYRPLTTLTGYTNVDGTPRVGGARFDNLTVTKLAEAERYTYNFDGRSQAIDHVVVNNLLNGVATYDIVHLNTGFNAAGTGINASPALSDHDPAVASFDYRSFGETLNGTAGADTILGLGGDDILDGKGGVDTLVGGVGNDIYYVDDLNDVVTELAGEGSADEVRSTVAGYVLPANVEIFTYIGTDPAPTIRGSSGNNTINGSGGNELFNLSDGGTDTVSGGAGNDGFAFGATFDSTDRVSGGTGTNDQIGLQGNYIGGNALTVTGAMVTGVEVLAVLPGFSYALTTTDDLVAAGATFTLYAGQLGAGDSFAFNGAAETNGSLVVYGGGGTDTIVTGGGNDSIYFGPGKFNPLTDTVDGGTGNDMLGLDGNYAITLTNAAVRNVEVVTLLGGIVGDLATYDITLANDLTPNGQTLTINAVAVQTALTINGGTEADGNIRILSGIGNDVLTGGAGADYFYGNLGRDTMTGGGGDDVFRYQGVGESTGVNRDLIIGFATEDRIQLGSAVTGVDATVTVGNVSTASFDADLQAALQTGQLGANHAVVFTASGGDLSGRTFLVIDANGSAGYQAGADYVIELQSPTALVTPANFIV